MKAKTKKLALLSTVSLIVGLCCLLVLEGISSLALAWLDSAEAGIKEESHSKYDPLLGWTNVASGEFRDLYGEGIHLTTNGQGLRGTRDYTAEVPQGTYRFLCLGDSFTLGYGVGDDETFEALLEGLADGIEVVNMGQGGYGVDQCYMWYKRDGVKLETDALLFVVIRDDFYRMLRSSFVVYPKPVLAIEDDELKVLNVPVPESWGSESTRAIRLLRRSALHRILRSDSPLRGGPEPVRFDGGELPFAETAERVLADLKEISRSRDQEFAVVFLPDRTDLKLDKDGEFVAWLEEVTGRLEVPMIDLTPAFRSLSSSERNYHFLPDGHYSLVGNRLVARVLLERTRALWPEVPQ